MELLQQINKTKGGRPPKTVKRNQFIGVRCSLIEKKLIVNKAKTIALTASEYLRETGLNRQADIKIKALPKEVLQLAGTLNHLAANMNQVAKKRNRMDELNAIERAGLMELSEQVKKLAIDIKNFLR